MPVNKISVADFPNSKETIGNQEAAESNLQGKKHTLLPDIRQFTKEVSIVGLKYVTNRDALAPRRVVWCSFVILGFVFAVYQITMQARYFMEFPTNVDININSNDSVTFPTVTICNENMFNKTAVEAFDPKVAKALKILYPPMADPSLHINFTQAFELLQDHEDQNWTAIWPTLYSDVWATTYMCLYNSQQCDPGMYRAIVTDVGRCLQFNYEGTLKANQAGAQSGLQMNLLTDHKNYLSPLSPSAGYRVYLHAANEPALIVESAFKANVNQHTQIQISAQTIKKMPAPYGPCSDEVDYVEALCERNCVQDYILSECGCVNMRMSYDQPGNNVSVCSPGQLFSCLLQSYYNFYGDNLQQQLCDCPSQCELTLYPYAISASETSDFFLEWAIETYPQFNLTADWIKKEFVLFDIFFSKLEYEVLETVPAYSLLSLLCDIGGALGLVLGSTVLTVFEIGDFCCVMLWDNLSRKRKQQQ